jgi:hypothetical protein
VRLFIEVEDYDSFNSDDHVDDVYVTITRAPSSSFSSRRAYNGIHGNSRIELSFRVQCMANFYGSDCATRCVPRDDSGGHYRCGSNGERICLSGWSEPTSDCTTGTTAWIASSLNFFHSYNKYFHIHDIVPSPHMHKQQLCVPVDAIQLEDIATILDSACNLLQQIIIIEKLCLVFRCRSGWSGLNCDTCSPQQGCCKSI